ncbi:hypothetical protein KDA_35730 [Dictyobacter alpinus]|uniref:Uncharacterized protein n=1 Tax=Dictyobacter alpinus TaxID=2014873 RepID=A0A402B9W0_9CHLR|nr:hypothetical protein KDA_35730 [Dictyobacter alpinus]
MQSSVYNTQTPAPVALLHTLVRVAVYRSFREVMDRTEWRRTQAKRAE